MICTPGTSGENFNPQNLNRVSTERFFQAGGSLAVNIPSYVTRQADEDLYKYLKAGDFCYVLTARQMGKSSLKVKVMQQLSAEGWVNVGIDLTAFGSRDFNSSQWYYSFLYEIAYTLDLDEIFETWWGNKQNFTPVARMSAFWEEVLLPNCPQNIAIYIDEIDTMLSLDKNHFSTDDFFAAIRATYNRRGTHPALNRLNFCIFGVAAPQDLMSDHERTPFNIGEAIKLDIFTIQNTTPLLAGFQASPEVAQALLERILHWTNGQPYLTQKLCLACVAEHFTEETVEYGVDEQVKTLFLQGNILDSDTHFSNIQSRILENKQYNLRMLEVYRELFQHNIIPLDNRSTEQLYLKLAGIAREENSSLEINNRIYREIFDTEWLHKIYEAIERPLSVDLDRWLSLKRSPDALLKGQVLANAEEWANKRKDLTQEELAFLNASKLEALRSEQELLLQNERNKQQKRLRLALVAAVVMALIAIITALIAINQAKLAQRGESKASNRLHAFRFEAVADDLKEQDANLSIRLLELALKYDNNSLIQKSIRKLYDQGDFPKIFVDSDHLSSISAVAFSPNGESILTGSYDKTARLWNVKSQKIINTFSAHQDAVWAVTFSPNGQSILTGSDDKTARLWDVKSGKLIHTFRIHLEAVRAVAFSPDGQFILTGSTDQTARLWNLQSKKLIHTFRGHQDAVWAVAFSPDGQSILTGSWDQTVRLWSVKTKKLIHSFRGHQGAVRAIDFSSDGQFILTGSDDNTARLWDVKSGKLIYIFNGHEDAVTAVSFSPDDQYMISGSLDNTSRLWNIKSRKIIHLFSGHQYAVTAVAYSPNGQTIVTSSYDKTVKLWNIKSGNLIYAFTRHQDAVTTVAFSPDGQSILTGSYDKTVILWDIKSRKIQHTFRGHQDAVLAVSFSPDGQFILSSSFDKTTRLWDVKSGKLIRTFTANQGAVRAVAFSPDGQSILTGSDDKTSRLWDVNSGNLINTYNGHLGEVFAVAFSPDGQFIITGSYDKTARLWDIYGNLIRDFKGHQDAVLAANFSPNGQSILTGSLDKTVNLWDIKSGKIIQSFRGHQKEVSAVAFSSDGQSILSGSYDKTARLWKINTPLAPSLEQFLRSKELLPLQDLLTYINPQEGKYRRLLEVWDILQKEPPKGKKIER